MSKVNPGDASLLARELDAVVRSAEEAACNNHDEAVLLTGAAARLSAQLVELTEEVEKCYFQYWKPEFPATDSEEVQS